MECFKERGVFQVAETESQAGEMLVKANWIHPELRKPRRYVYPACSANREARYWRDEKNQTYKCTRKAIVRINRKNYCYQHGGQIALTILVEGDK